MIIYLILPYCDDFLIIIHGDSKEVWWQRELQAKAVVLEALERLGLTRQPTKGQWTGLNWIHHLGLRIETEGGDGVIRVTPQRVGKISSQGFSFFVSTLEALRIAHHIYME